MPVLLVADDIISRCIIFDRAFNHDIHVDEFLWRFESSKEDGTYHESAVLRRLAVADNDVHAIGCNIAESQNIRKNLEPGPRRRYYCGFRSACYGDLPTGGEDFSISITNVPENDEESHVDVALTLHVPNTKANKNKRANKRTDAGLALAEHFGSATPHRCECDACDHFHPFDRYGLECLNSGLRKIA